MMLSDDEKKALLATAHDLRNLADESLALLVAENERLTRALDEWKKSNEMWFNEAKKAHAGAAERERELANFEREVADLLDTLDLKAGHGPTALTMLAQEAERVREALAQLVSEHHGGWHDLSKAPEACEQYPCTLLTRRPAPEQE